MLWRLPKKIHSCLTAHSITEVRGKNDGVIVWLAHLKKRDSLF